MELTGTFEVAERIKFDVDRLNLGLAVCVGVLAGAGTVNKCKICNCTPIWCSPVDGSNRG